MSHSHTFAWRPRLFRAFVTNQYYANRDEYDAVGQVQPYTFEEYVRLNINDLRKQYKKIKEEVDKPRS